MMHSWGSYFVHVPNYQHKVLHNKAGIRFITLRRRGKKLIDNIDNLGPWQCIHIPHVKIKYPKPLVYESMVEMKNYSGKLRQVIIRGYGRENPTFLISNDFETPVEILVGNYSRRWRVENVISEAVNFFNLNMLSSPILIKVHFDVVMTMIADTLYSMLSKKLRGFEDCDVPKIYRDFVRRKGKITIDGKKINVTYPKRAHNPILRSVPWYRMSGSLTWLNGAELKLEFQ
ncbi:MAG: hypothetical protein JJV89_02410 [Desulfosarcina sp.]|nr:hypothetical protein [Desulfobacterales bacterium]